MSQINYNYNNVNSLLLKNNRVHFSEQRVPIVIRAHVNLMSSSYIEIPNNFLVVTFVTDGLPVCDIEGNSVHGHTTRCKSKTAKYVYIWNRFLLNVAELVHSSPGSDFIDTMKDNMPRLNADLQAYRDEFHISIDSNLEYTTVYYPGDLICNTAYEYHNDKHYRMGVTSWDEFLRQKKTSCLTRICSRSTLRRDTRSLEPQNSGVMYLHNVMDYMTRTIPTDTVKVVFSFSCWFMTDPLRYRMLRVKPEHSYLYKNLFGHLHHIEQRLSAQKRTLNRPRLEQRAAQKTGSPDAMYHKLCFGSVMNFASKLKKLQSNSYCVYFEDVCDENLKNEHAQGGRMIGMHVPVHN
jgi:hypothetical protein